jgi:polyadenylate-binding protein
VTPQPKKLAQPASISSPQTPDLSSRGPSAAASPTPTTPGNNIAGISYTIASLARLPAAEIIRLANSSNATGLPLPKADALIVRTTDEFIDGLLDKPIQQQKQALGEKLFKVVKSLGIKGAPKVTIALLDQEDLRALAHLMNSYPSVLKEKALAIGVAK